MLKESISSEVSFCNTMQLTMTGKKELHLTLVRLSAVLFVVGQDTQAPA